MKRPPADENDRIRVVVTGGRGQVGQALVAAAPEHAKVLSLGRSDLDIIDRAQVSEVVEALRPEVIVNCAAFTRVDDAETEVESAYAVNFHGAGHLADAAALTGARLIHVSTDFVFDGLSDMPYSPSAATNPLSIYGKSKLAGEAAVLEKVWPKALIVRTAWLYSAVAPNFVLTMLRLMRERSSVKVVADQRGSPTWARSLAQVIWRFVGRPELRGVYHWTDDGITSWYDFAVVIYEEARERGLVPPDVGIAPVSTSEFPRPAVRPSFSALDASQAVEATGTRQVAWRENLRNMLDGLTS